MPIGTVPPPTQHPDEEPLVCISLNQEWIPILLGAVQPLKYPEYWSGTLEENRGARRDWGLLINQIMQIEECLMAAQCCVPPVVITRIDPDTGIMQVSYDEGESWSTNPDTVQKYITIPQPPITSGVAATKCDAATNIRTQVQAWIDQVLTDFDTATVLLDFALAVAEAVLAAVLTILSAGTLSVAQALILPVISAAATAVFGAGKVAFEDYWTDDAKDKVLCAALCAMADDGSFNDSQFSTFWNKVNHDLPVGPAKMLFMGFLSSVGKAGLNAMAASGMSADSDCADCHCGDHIRIYVSDGGGTQDSWDGEYLICTPVLGGDSLYHMFVQYSFPTSSLDNDVCGQIDSITALSGEVTSYFYKPCHSNTFVSTGVTPVTDICACQWDFRSEATFQLKIRAVTCT